MKHEYGRENMTHESTKDNDETQIMKQVIKNYPSGSTHQNSKLFMQGYDTDAYIGS